jgi:histidinol dehydrogenase
MSSSSQEKKTLQTTWLNASDNDFEKKLSDLLAWEAVSSGNVNQIVDDIIDDVRKDGDKAVVEYSNKFDRMSVESMADLTVEQAELKACFDRLPLDQQNALKVAAERVENYHVHQKAESWSYTESDGTVLGQQVTAMDRVGLYVPGGTAPLASSVIMNAMPAKVAGVGEVVMMSPTPDGIRSDFLLGAAHVAGIDKVLCIGGAQAIAALAYGTESIDKVDKIVGPGNIFVATAKRAVFGQVGIDMIAGPSEIMVVSDGLTNPDWLAMDLFSQAEHDTDAQSIIVSSDKQHLDDVFAACERLIETLERKEIAYKSFEDRSAFILVESDKQCLEMINRIAPEHLELSVEDPDAWLPEIRHAGAIFMGRYTAEALGDYCAGPNHVLPTSGTARFSSPLGVYDFQKRSSIIKCSADGASEMGKVASILARGEGLDAHAKSAEYRIK